MSSGWWDSHTRAGERHSVPSLSHLCGTNTARLFAFSLTLEDLSGTVDIDVSKAETTVGFFTENSIVLAVGQMEDGVFHVSMFGLPPPETRADSHQALGKLDFFGEASKTLDVSRLEVPLPLRREPCTLSPNLTRS